MKTGLGTKIIVLRYETNSDLSVRCLPHCQCAFLWVKFEPLMTNIYLSPLYNITHISTPKRNLLAHSSVEISLYVCFHEGLNL